jgi:hypothetical protein
VIFTNFLGHSVDVAVEKVDRELRDLVEAASEACAATSTEPEIERLRHARLTFMKALNRETSS